MWVSHDRWFNYGTRAFTCAMTHSQTHSHLSLTLVFFWTGDFIMAHVWMSHSTCEWVMAHVWMSHGKYVNESWHIYEWVIAHVSMSHGTCEWVMTHVNESWHMWMCPDLITIHAWHMYEWVMVHVSESCHTLLALDTLRFCIDVRCHFWHWQLVLFWRSLLMSFIGHIWCLLLDSFDVFYRTLLMSFIRLFWCLL